ncbi:hypothetical protein FHH43_07850 [Clostridium perfringens]|nr:hypothetical protein [Clostridium perfringens]
MYLDNYLDYITLDSLLRYLEYKEWNINNDFPNKNLILLEKKYDADDVYTITLPAKETLKDFKRRLTFAIESLAELDEISKNDLLKDIIFYSKNLKKNESIVSKDRLSIRIKSDISEDGSLPLDYASSVVNGIKKLLTSAIYIEKNTPIPVLDSSHNLKTIDGDLKNYKFAQSEYGSYIFNIDIESVSDTAQLSFDFENNDFITPSRKVIRRIQNGIYDIQNKKIEEIYINGYEKGLNANMCDAILEFNNIDSPVIIESKIKWDSSLPIPKDIKDTIYIRKDDFSVFDSISKRYKEKTVEKMTLEGFIIEMHNNENTGKTKRVTRYIVIITNIESSLKKVKLYLNEDDYNLACNAHREKKLVSVEGFVIPKSKNYILEDYMNFKIL